VSWPQGYRDLFQQTGEFVLTIHVTADNAGTAIKRLILNWKGDWQNFTVDEFPELEWSGLPQ
jgi:hypothetical protein